MTDSTFRIERLTSPVSASDVDELARLLADAVAGGAAVSFINPMSHDGAVAWWRETIASMAPRGAVLVARWQDRIVGSVQLHPAWAPNQPHRADVAKLLVHSDCRGRGLGERLMQTLEFTARDAGFSLLTLDTKAGTAAERLYRRLGWTAAGTIPGFAVDPDGPLHDAVFFYKALA